MTIECGVAGRIPYDIAPDDEFQVTFDISEWLGTDTIASVTYTAVDEDGTDATSAVIDQAECDNDTQVIKPYIKGGGTDGKRYTVKCEVTTSSGYVKMWYVRFAVEEVPA